MRAVDVHAEVAGDAGPHLRGVHVAAPAAGRQRRPGLAQRAVRRRPCRASGPAAGRRVNDESTGCVAHEPVGEVELVAPGALLQRRVQHRRGRAWRSASRRAARWPRRPTRSAARSRRSAPPGCRRARRPRRGTGPVCGLRIPRVADLRDRRRTPTHPAAEAVERPRRQRGAGRDGRDRLHAAERVGQRGSDPPPDPARNGWQCP